MFVQGAVRLTGRLDWEISQVFIGDYKDLKEGLCILLRIGVFQLFYMNNVPDYAAVTSDEKGVVATFPPDHEIDGGSQ